MTYLIDWFLTGRNRRRPPQASARSNPARSVRVQPPTRPVRVQEPLPAVTISPDRSWTGTLSRFLLRYGLVLVVAWTGAMKFTVYEAVAIQPLVATSPVISWIYRLWSVTAAAKLIGILDLTTAALIASRPFSPRACIVGSAMGSATFAVTSTFLVSAPGWAESLGGFPALSFDVGQVYVKDIVLLGTALWSMSEARTALRRQNR